MSKIRIIEIPIYTDDRGSLLAVEQNSRNLPFDPVRTFYLINVSKAKKRACHAVDCSLFLLPIKGSVTLKSISQDKSVSKWVLNKSNFGALVPPLTYIELLDFTDDAILAVSASKVFSETNYFSLNDILNGDLTNYQTA